MVSYQPFTVNQQNLAVEALVERLDGLDQTGRDEYIGYQAHVDLARLVNNTRSTSLSGVYDSVRRSHGNSVVGSMGVVLTAALATSLGTGVIVINKGGNLVVPGGEHRMVKTSIHDATKGSRRNHKAKFHPSQLTASSARATGILAIDILGTNKADVHTHVVSTSDVSHLQTTSAQTGVYSLHVPARAAGTTTPQSASGMVLARSICATVDTYVERLLQGA